MAPSEASVFIECAQPRRERRPAIFDAAALARTLHASVARCCYFSPAGAACLCSNSRAVAPRRCSCSTAWRQRTRSRAPLRSRPSSALSLRSCSRNQAPCVPGGPVLPFAHNKLAPTNVVLPRAGPAGGGAGRVPASTISRSSCCWRSVRRRLPRAPPSPSQKRRRRNPRHPQAPQPRPRDAKEGRLHQQGLVFEQLVGQCQGDQPRRTARVGVCGHVQE